MDAIFIAVLSSLQNRRMMKCHLLTTTNSCSLPFGCTVSRCSTNHQVPITTMVFPASSSSTHNPLRRSSRHQAPTCDDVGSVAANERPRREAGGDGNAAKRYNADDQTRKSITIAFSALLDKSQLQQFFRLVCISLLLCIAFRCCQGHY